MEVHSTRVDAGVGGYRIDVPQHPPRVHLDDVHRIAVRRTKINSLDCPFGPRPEPPARPAAQRLLTLELGKQLHHSGSEVTCIVQRQRHLLRGGCQLWSQYRGVLRAQHRTLDRGIKELLRMIKQVGVNRMLSSE